MSSSVFDHIARLVLVRNLRTKLGPQLDGDQAIDEAWEVLRDAPGGWDQISLVAQNGRIIGYVEYDSAHNEGTTVSDVTKRIQPDSVLSADATALEAVDLFTTTQRDFFFVLDHTQFTGTLNYNDLFCLPFKLCLFALTLHLEDSALRLISISPQESWQSLPEGRRRKAEDICKARYRPSSESREIPPGLFLGCTQYCDKGTILKKRELLPNVTKEEIDSVFDRAEKVRDACAHTSPDQYGEVAVITREKLGPLIRDIQTLIQAIELSIDSIAPWENW